MGSQVVVDGELVDVEDIAVPATEVWLGREMGERGRKRRGGKEGKEEEGGRGEEGGEEGMWGNSVGGVEKDNLWFFAQFLRYFFFLFQVAEKHWYDYPLEGVEVCYYSLFLSSSFFLFLFPSLPLSPLPFLEPYDGHTRQLRPLLGDKYNPPPPSPPPSSFFLTPLFLFF